MVCIAHSEINIKVMKKGISNPKIEILVKIWVGLTKNSKSEKHCFAQNIIEWPEK
jgi:hypothetical protein